MLSYRIYTFSRRLHKPLPLEVDFKELFCLDPGCPPMILGGGSKGLLSRKGA